SDRRPDQEAVTRRRRPSGRYGPRLLAQVRADLNAKTENPQHKPVPWTAAALRKKWNQEKNTVAPWWAENSKECYSSGISDLVDALGNWSDSKRGKRRGRWVGFPRFQSRRDGRNRVRFTTGTMRLEEDKRHITLPVIGKLRSKENTRRVHRHVAKGNARVLSMTLSERWGRLFVSVQYAVRVRVPTRPVPERKPRTGVDLGLRTYATVADSDGYVVEFPNPACLRATLAQRKRLGRKMVRCIPGSRQHRAAKTKLARLDRKAVHLRRETVHQLTRWLVDNYNQVLIEDLDLAAMRRSMGRRAFRRSVSDASLGMFRPTLAYKAETAGVEVVVADRWFASSQTHHNCGGKLEGKKLAKELCCGVCEKAVDRDINAAFNLRDWPERNVSSGPVGASAPPVPRPPSVVQTAGPTVGSDRWMRPGKSSGEHPRPQAGEARTERNPEKGATERDH
ncbi:MAG: IS607 family element RNA-guided endonuclease TnpB, partial [Acidimicrobiales bacterium]